MRICVMDIITLQITNNNHYETLANYDIGNCHYNDNKYHCVTEYQDVT